MANPSAETSPPKLSSWDAGTVVNEEPGIAPNQAPRQKAPNAGKDGTGVVQNIKDRFTYPNTASVMKLTITAAKAPGAN